MTCKGVVYVTLSFKFTQKASLAKNGAELTNADCRARQ